MIASVTPSIASVGGGGIVTVIGSGMSADGLTCRFGEAQVREQGVRWQTSTSVACVVPPYPAAAGGMVMVELSNNGGSDFTAAGAGFMYQASVSVVSVRPSRALAGAEGQTVTVIGQNFGAGDTMCLFGKSAVAPARIVSSTSYFAAPVVDYVWPVKGRVSGGVSMNMYGKGFAADGMSCRFGGEVVSTATFVSSTAAACTAPAWMSTGVVTVEVSLNDGADFSDVGAECQFGADLWRLGTVVSGTVVPVEPDSRQPRTRVGGSRRG